MSLLARTEIGFADSPAVGAFGRLRISNPVTLFDSKQIYDNQPLLWDDAEVSGGSTTSVHSVAEARTRIGVGNTTAGKRVRQTFMRFNYNPGKSQLVLMTFVLGSKPTGITSAVGVFDDDNGLFFQVKDGVASFNIRSSTSGSAVDTSVVQSSWNVDKLDGTGTSGITLDSTKTQILFIDYEWLGVGRVRLGCVLSGKFIVAHEFLKANSLTSVYMSTPNLPLRYSIENDGTAAATTLDHICSTVISEGGRSNSGSIRYKSTAGAAITATTDNIIYAIVGLKLKAANVSASIEILNVGIQIQTNSESGEWTLRLNPTIAGVFTYANETNSSLMSALGATANTVTGGTIITGGFAQSGTAGNGRGGTESPVDNAIRLGSTIAGVVDEIVLCWMPNSGTVSHAVEGGVTWQESL